MQPLVDTFMGGVNTAEDPAEIGENQLTEAIGAIYKPGDMSSIHKLGGRTSFGVVTEETVVDSYVDAETGLDVETTIEGGPVEAVRCVQFDNAPDMVAALSAGEFKTAQLGTTGTFSSALSGLAHGGKLAHCHANDRHYFGNGVDRNWVLESDGTVRYMSMFPPHLPISLESAAAAGTIFNPTAVVGGEFTSPELAVDASDDTYASASHITRGQSKVQMWEFTTSNAGAGRYVTVTWGLATGRGILRAGRVSRADRGAVVDSGMSEDSGTDAKIEFDLSEDDGVTWTNKLTIETRTAQESQISKFKITNSINLNLVWVRARFTVRGVNVATLRVYRVRAQDDSNSSNFSTTNGIWYAVSEYDRTRDQASPIGEPVFIELATKNRVKVTFPTSAVNSRSTHWIVYKTGDGGEAPHQLGRVALVPIAEDTWYDDFVEYPSDVQPSPLYPMIAVNVPGQTTPLRFDRDTPAPPMDAIKYFQGGAIGFSLDNQRGLRGSLPGFIESWPDIYSVLNIPLPENDRLVTGEEIGGSFVLAAEGALLRMDSFPRSVNGQFVGSVVQIPGAPGCVGKYAACAYSISGENLFAWISSDGQVYATNGYQFWPLMDQIDMSSYRDLTKKDWVLRYWHKYRVLVYAFSTEEGDNDRFWTIHVSPEFAVGDTTRRRVTGPHYGSIKDFSSCVSRGTHVAYSAHPSDGDVYLEDSGGVDESNSLDSDQTHRFQLTTRKQYEGDSDYAVFDAKLQHSNWGEGNSLSVAYTVGRDSSEHTDTKEVTVSLEGAKRTQFEIGRSGEWHQFTMTHDGTGTGRIVGMIRNAEQFGVSGEAS